MTDHMTDHVTDHVTNHMTYHRVSGHVTLGHVTYGPLQHIYLIRFLNLFLYRLFQANLVVVNEFQTIIILILSFLFLNGFVRLITLIYNHVSPVDDNITP